MKIIKDYVDQVFKTVPLTEETNQLRTDILANMEDKYNELINAGASEHEAIGVVIAEFGNIDELLEEMGISRVSKERREHYPTMEEEGIEYFLQTKGTIGLRVGLGVLSVLAGVGGLIVLMGLQNVFQAALLIGLVFLLAFLVVGIALFILEGMRAADLKAYHKPFVLLPDLREHLEEQQQAYKKSLAISIVLGASLCILSLTPMLLGAMTNLIPVLVGVGLMLVLIGTGIVCFTYSGNVYNAYTILLTNGKDPNSFEEEVKAEARRKRIDYIIDEVYWPIIVVIYFAASFLIGGSFWAWSWVVFVLGGALEGTIKSIFDTWDN